MLAEIRAEQLSFTADEAAALLGAERVQLSAEALADSRGPDRGLAGRRLPRRPVLVRPTERRRARAQPERQRPVRHQLLLRRGAQPGLGAGPRLHHHHVDPRPLLRAAVRRGRRHDGSRRAARRPGAHATCSWSRWTVMGDGSGSTTCSPRWRAASWRPGTPTGCRSCTSVLRSGTEANGHIDEAITHLRAAGLRREAARAGPGQLADLRRRRPSPHGARVAPVLGQEPRRLRPGRGRDGGMDGRAVRRRSRAGPARAVPRGVCRPRAAAGRVALGGVGAGADRGLVRLRRTARDAPGRERAVELETDGSVTVLCHGPSGAGSRRVRRRRAQPGDGAAGHGELSVRRRRPS